jgi:type I restriction enzyme R subunit
VFDSVLVITDRKIIDAQLSATISSFEQTPGVVAALGRTSRGKQLKELLEGGTKIIIGTLQTFPVIAETLINKQGSKFAVIVDEAHSSSSGEMSKALKKVLDSDSEDDVEEEDTTWEDKIDEEMKLRGRQEHISYFAFTATPKPKTLELFGKKQAPEVKPEFRPHHTYSMKQAIQEGFIKDVLPNYTSYKTCYHLLKKIENDPNYDKKKATKLLKVFVELSEPTVAKKTAIIIEHFMENCISEVDGQAKAMVVCASRLQAVKYWLAFNEYLKEIGTPFKALIAFSGIVEVKKPHAEYSEARMNGFPEEQTAQRFRERENKFLIVANKFQTGFDQPLLYAMYINKKLNGVNAVQTLSRLNRVHPNKKDPVTLDFFNEPKIIKEAFQDFYEETMLEEASDPDKMYDYKRQLEVYQYYTQAEVDEFNKLLRVKNFDQSKLNPIINSAVKRYEQDGDKKNRDNFRMLLKTYLRVYSFLAQIVSFQDRELEKLYVYGMILFRKLPFEKGRLPKEVTQQVDLETLKVQYIKKGIKLDEDEGGILKHGDDDPFAAGEEFLEPLSKILKLINEMFAANFSDEDRIVAQDLLAKLSADPSFADEIKNNPKEAVWFVFERRFNDALQSLLEIQYEFYKKLNHDDDTKERLMKEMFGVLYERVKKR